MIDFFKVVYFYEELDIALLRSDVEFHSQTQKIAGPEIRFTKQALTQCITLTRGSIENETKLRAT